MEFLAGCTFKQRVRTRFSDNAQIDIGIGVGAISSHRPPRKTRSTFGSSANAANRRCNKVVSRHFENVTWERCPHERERERERLTLCAIAVRGPTARCAGWPFNAHFSHASDASTTVIQPSDGVLRPPRAHLFLNRIPTSALKKLTALRLLSSENSGRYEQYRAMGVKEMQNAGSWRMGFWVTLRDVVFI
ncbi:hypothetical protein EDE09_1146 [Neorhizobium sp. S3-V5DH]|nr:hypothetical protein EDE09_1146 [Neorhizobium sp. S3-V5DH]